MDRSRRRPCGRNRPRRNRPRPLVRRQLGRILADYDAGLPARNLRGLILLAPRRIAERLLLGRMYRRNNGLPDALLRPAARLAQRRLAPLPRHLLRVVLLRILPTGVL